MSDLTSAQRKYLRALAHHLDPLVLIGKHGLTDMLIRAAAEALDAHELIKVRFNDHKDEKRAIAAEIARRTGAQIVGSLGHVYIFYWRQPDAEKRKIELPQA